MKRYQVTIVGVTSLLMDRITPEELENVRTKKNKKFKAPDDPRETADKKVYRHPQDDPKGKPYMPLENFVACLIEGGRYIQLSGKRCISNASSTMLPAFVTFDPQIMYLKDPKNPKKDASWEVDMRPARNKTGDLVCAVRPRFDRWQFDVNFLVDTDSIDEGKIRELVDISGVRLGLGAFRPQKKGIFGQYKVQCWKCLGSMAEAAE